MPTTPVVFPKNIHDFVLNDGHGVKGLADMGIKILPKQYIHPQKERFISNNNDLNIISCHNNNNDNLIPIIDMSNKDVDALQYQICKAAEKWGFFQIINHGVPLEVLEDVKNATYKFFELPAEEKRKYLKENSGTNCVRYGTSFVPQIEKALEWKDYLSLLYVSRDEALARWPLACRDEALELMKSSEVIIRKILMILMKGLNIYKIDEKKESQLMGSKRIDLNIYPKCPNPELTVGVGRHSDVSTLTILLQDDVGGLYIRGLDGETWIHVPPIKGALVINIGDALQILSNGKYKSIEHRVTANGSMNRISVPIFVNPKHNEVVGPFPELLNDEEKPIYKEVLYSDYVKYFYKKPHDGKDTLEFAKLSR